MVGVVLAGGASKRMGTSKPLVKEGGASFAASAIQHLWTACDVVIVVLGAGAKKVQEEIEFEFERLAESGKLHQALAEAHRHGAKGLEVRFVTNPSWKRGMLGSVKLGLREAARGKPEGIVVLPVDHPEVAAATIRDIATLVRLARQACRTPRERSRFRYALVPRYRRRRGHPVAVTTALARDVIDDKDAADLSDAIRRNARMVGYLDVNDAGVVSNRNTPRRAKAKR